MKKRYNIGLLVAGIVDPFSNACAVGAMRAAKKLDVNLIIFPGKYIGLCDLDRSAECDYENQYNILFRYAAAAKLDYLIIATGSVAYACDDRQKAEFLRSFGDVPLISLAANIPGFDFMQFDCRNGISAAVDYLAAHGRSYIGMLTGNLNNVEMRERADIFRERLARNGLDFHESAMLECDMAYLAGDQVIELLDQNPKLDAILCVNDIVASVVYDVLKKRGIRAGEDIAVIGYDDLPLATALDPPLATVRANADKLAAAALEKAVRVLEGKCDPDSEHYLETVFIPRSSCHTDVKFLRTPEKLFDGTPDQVRSNLAHYVADLSDSPMEMDRICDNVFGVYDHLVHTYIDQPAPEDATEQTLELLRPKSRREEFSERLYDLGKGAFFWLLRNCHPDNLQMVQQLYAHFGVNVDTRLSDWMLADKNLKRAHLESLFIRDTLTFGSDLKRGYAMILHGLCNIGAPTAFLYTADKPFRYLDDAAYSTPVWHFKSYSYGSTGYTVPEEREIVSAPEMFDNDYTDADRQHVFVATILFSGDVHYGMVLLEPYDEAFLEELELVTYQLSSAVRTLDVMFAQDQLLSQIHSKNLALDKLSKIDELTHVYNRRGFYVAAESMLAKPEYRQKPMLVCYADMDDLKGINDNYGHQEGDACIQQVAECLNYALGTGAVLARFGGDEFAGILPDAAPEMLEAAAARKQHFLKLFNETSGKPYTLDVSAGFLLVQCASVYDLKNAIDDADNLLYDEKREKKRNRARKKQNAQSGSEI